MGNSIIWGQTEACDCPEGRAAAEKKEAERLAAKNKRKAEEEREAFLKRWEYSGMGLRQSKQTFESFQPQKGSQRAYEEAKNFAHNFRRRNLSDPITADEKCGLVFLGGVGSGKTHLAAAIANYVLTNGDYITFRTVPALASELKQSFNNADGMSEGDLMRRYKRTSLLILDDLGKEQPSEWFVSKLYEIIDSRYENYMPIIVTANYNFETLKERLGTGNNTTATALISRLQGMCTVLSVVGRDMRTSK